MKVHTFLLLFKQHLPISFCENSEVSSITGCEVGSGVDVNIESTWLLSTISCPSYPSKLFSVFTSTCHTGSCFIVKDDWWFSEKWKMDGRINICYNQNEENATYIYERLIYDGLFI